MPLLNLYTHGDTAAVLHTLFSGAADSERRASYFILYIYASIHAKRENKMPLTKIFSPNVSFRNLLAELQ